MLDVAMPRLRSNGSTAASQKANVEEVAAILTHRSSGAFCAGQRTKTENISPSEEEEALELVVEDDEKKGIAGQEPRWRRPRGGRD